jgi:serine protease Do
VGFAIPINLVRNVAEQIVNTGRVDRGYLGIAPQMLSPELAEQFGTFEGALVAEVTPGGAADKAGLKSGDVITKIGGTPVRDPGQLLLTVSQLAPGSDAKIEYLRDGQRHTATARLQRRPEQTLARDDSSAPSHRGMKNEGVLDGVGVTDLTPQIRDQLDIPPRVQGAVIAEIDPASPAASEGLQPGDVILELDRKSIRNAQQAVQLSEQIKGPKVMARIWREGHSHFVVIDESHS